MTRGFTLVEVLVLASLVLLLSAIGVAVVAPAIKHQRQAAATRSIPALIETAAALARAKHTTVEVRRDGNRVYVAVCSDSSTCADAGAGGSYEVFLPSGLSATTDTLWVRFDELGLPVAQAPDLFVGNQRIAIGALGTVQLQGGSTP